MPNTNRFSAIARIFGAFVAAALLSLAAAPQAMAQTETTFNSVVTTPLENATPTVGSLFAVTYQFNVTSVDNTNGVVVTGFDTSDIEFPNADATVTSITRASTTNIYTVNIRPNAGYSGSLTIRMVPNAVQYVVTNQDQTTTTYQNSEITRTVTVDQGKPTLTTFQVEILGGTDPTQHADDDKVVNGKFQVRFIFNEAITGFTAGDISASNATKSDFTTVTAGTAYTVDIEPNAGFNGDLTVSVPSGSVTDLVGNMVEKTDLKVKVDQTKPTVTISAPSEWGDEPFTATITFSEVVVGFDSGDVTVKEFTTISGGTGTDVSLTSFIGSGRDYTATMAPTGTTIKRLEIAIAANVANDLAGIGSGNELPGNGNTAAPTKTVTIDAARPTITATSITKDSNGNVDLSGDSTTTFTVGITFSEQVIGFQQGGNDIYVTYGTGTTKHYGHVALTGALPGNSFTATVTPTANYEGDLTIHIPANAAQSSADNTKGNPAFSQTVRVSQGAPTVTIALDKSRTNGTVTATATFSEPVTGFERDSSDIAISYVGAGTITPAMISDYTVSGTSTYKGETYATTYAVTVTLPDVATDGNVIVFNVELGAATDIVGNSSNRTSTAEPSRKVTVDKTAPTLTISAAGSASAGFVTTFTFNEDIKDGTFTASDITVVGGTVGTVTGAKKSWKATITPNAGFSGTLTINVAANVLEDIAGNGNKVYDRVPDVDGMDETQGIQPWEVIVDTTKPTVTLTAQDKANGFFTATLVFSEAVTGVAAEDFTVPMISNGREDDENTTNVDESKSAQATVSNISGAATTWTARITPRAAATDLSETPDLDESKAFNGNLAISFKADGAADAAGNGNVVSNTKTINIDTVRPTVTISTIEKDYKEKFTATFTFDESVTGFDSTDITVNNGLIVTPADDFSGTGTTYTATITPTANFEGTLNINIAANKATDAHGNQNVASDADATEDGDQPYSVTIDTTAPVPKVVGVDESDGLWKIIDGNVTLDEFGTGADLELTVRFKNGTANNAADEEVEGLTTDDFTVKYVPLTADANPDNPDREGTEANGGATVKSVVASESADPNMRPYKVTITPAAFSGYGRRLRIYIAADRFTDKAGNDNVILPDQDAATGNNQNYVSITLRPAIPSIAITTDLTRTAFSGNDLSDGQPFTATFTSSQSLTVFDATDIDISAAGSNVGTPTLTNFSGTGTTYTVTVTPNLRVVDEAGNETAPGHTGNLTITVKRNIDGETGPDHLGASKVIYVDQDTPKITAFTGPYLEKEDGTVASSVTSLPLDGSAFYVKLTTDEEVENLSNANFVIYEVGDTKEVKTSVGSATKFTGSDPAEDGLDQTWDVKIQPNSGFSGNMAIQVKTGAGTDRAGNAVELANGLNATLGVDDQSNPTIVIDQAAPVPLITFTATEHGNRFVNPADPTSDQILNNVIPAGVSDFMVKIRLKDGSRTTGTGSAKTPIFEQVDADPNFTEGDIVVSPTGAGAVTDLVKGAGQDPNTVWTATITPTADTDPDTTGNQPWEGTITLSIAANKFKDVVGNDNLASNSFTAVIDKTAPELKSITQTAAVAPGQPFELEFEYTEAVIVTDRTGSDAGIQDDLNWALTVAGYNGTLAAPTKWTVQQSDAVDSTASNPGYDIAVSRVANSQTRFKAVITLHDDGDFDAGDDTDLNNVAVFARANGVVDLAIAGNAASFDVNNQYDPDNEDDEPDVLFSSSLDKTSPVVKIGREEDYDSASPVRYGFVFEFSQLITGFTESDFVVTNGAVVSGSLTQTYGSVPLNPKKYYARFTATGAGDLTIRLPAGAVTDAALNPSFAAEFTHDLGRPTPTIHVVKLENGNWVEDTSPAFKDDFYIEVRFNEDVDFVDIERSDDLGIAVSGGIESADVQHHIPTGNTLHVRDWLDKDGTLVPRSGSPKVEIGRIYRTKIEPSEFVGGKSDFSLSIGLAANAIDDESGNGNLLAQKTVQIDQTKPTVVITPTEIGNNVANGNQFTVTFTYSEPVTGFAASDITSVTGGTLVANTLTRAMKDGTVVTDPKKPAQVYTIKVDPNTGVTAVTFVLLAGVVEDEAGNLSAAYDGDDETTGDQPHNITVDTVSPQPVVSGPAGDKYGNGPFSITIKFSDVPNADPFDGEDVTGFTVGDLAVTGGSASNLVEVTKWHYTANITPTSPRTGSKVMVNIAANAVMDGAGNHSLAAAEYEASFDATLPYITGIAAPVASRGEFKATINFNESVSGFTGTYTGDNADLTITGGTVKGGSLETISSSSYSVVIVPYPAVADDPNTRDVNEAKDAFEGDLAISVNEGAAIATALPANRTTVASATTLVRIDRTAPKVTAFTLNNGANLGPSQFDFQVSITFDEDIDTKTWGTGDLAVTGGQVTSYSNIGNRTLTAMVNAPQQLATVTLGANTVTDIVGNGNAAHDGASISRASDNPTVTVAVSDGNYGPRTASAFGVTITFSQPVTGFVLRDLTVSGGTAGSFNAVTGGQIYTVQITPDSRQTTVNASVSANVATNARGLGNTAGSMSPVIVSSGALRTVFITSAATAPVTGAFNVNVSFSAAVSSFSKNAITVLNGTAGDPVHVSQSRNWRVSITPTGGEVQIYLVQNVLPGGNAPSNVYRIQSSVAPPPPDTLHVVLTGKAAVKAGASTVNVEFTRGPSNNTDVRTPVAVTGFELSDLTVANATLSDLAADASVAGKYSVKLTPAADYEGNLTVSLAAGSVLDDRGNPNPAASFQTRVDSTPPTVAISGPEGPANGAVEITITYSEPVSGFDADDLTVSGGTAGEITGQDAIYKATVTPADDYNGQLTVDVAADAAMDIAGNMNTAAEQYAVTIDQTPPTVTVTGPIGPINDEKHAVTIAFSEEVTDFDLSDIAVMLNGGSENVSVSDLTEDADTKGLYTAMIQAGAEGALTVDIAAGAAADLAANANTAADQYSVEVVLDTTFTVELKRGLNLIHIPVAVDGLNDPADPYKVSDLYDALGGLSGGVLYVLSLNDAGNFVAYTGSPGSSGDTVLSDHTAVIVNIQADKKVEFTGGLLEEEVSLKGGINLIGVPRYQEGRKATEVAKDAPGAIVLVLAKNKFGNDEFRLAKDDDEAYGGRGYIVFAAGPRDQITTITYTGEAWRDSVPEDTAPSTIASADALKLDPTSTPVLLVEGLFAREDTLEPINGLSVSIKNLRTGESIVDTAGLTAGSGRIATPIVALRGGQFETGDTLEVTVADSGGVFGGLKPVRTIVGKDEIASGRIHLGRQLLSAVPNRSVLLPNYPNPFNPETWIPFDLAESSEVRLTVYNAAGHTVRVLELGQLPAGQYRSRTKAAYWNGRNSLGEPVASGLYIIRIDAGSFSATRRMMILK